MKCIYLKIHLYVPFARTAHLGIAACLNMPVAESFGVQSSLIPF